MSSSRELDLKFELYLLNDRDIWRRRAAAFEIQVEALSGDPEEAPLYRRIAEQRKQLREQEKLIAKLRRGPGMANV